MSRFAHDSDRLLNPIAHYEGLKLTSELPRNDFLYLWRSAGRYTEDLHLAHVCDHVILPLLQSSYLPVRCPVSIAADHLWLHHVVNVAILLIVIAITT